MCVFKWEEIGLLLIFSWIDGYLVVGNKKEAIKAKKEFSKAFYCEDDGEIKERANCKIIND